MTGPRIIVAVQRGALIALRNSDAIVADIDGCCFRQGSHEAVLFRHPHRVGAGCNGFIFCLALLANAGSSISKDDLEQAIWGDDPDGGPLGIVDIFSQLAHAARPVLAWAGYGIRYHRCSRSYQIDKLPHAPALRSFAVNRYGAIRPAHQARAYNDGTPVVRGRRERNRIVRRHGPVLWPLGAQGEMRPSC